MHIDPREIEQLIEVSNRRVQNDQVAIARVETVVLAAVALYFVAAALGWALG